jgi:DNA-binding MarR family transcriptional regulator
MTEKRQVGPKPFFEVGPGFEKEWPGSSALATECVLNLYVAMSRLEGLSEASVRAAGFPSLAAFNVLTVLDGAGVPLTPSVIADRIFVTRGTMTGVLRSLETRGLIKLARNPEDGRSRKVELAPGARAKVRRYLHRVHDAERRLMEGLTHERQKDLLDILARLQDRLLSFAI